MSNNNVHHRDSLNENNTDENIGPHGETTYQQRTRLFIEGLIKGFIDYTRENNTRYSDYINQQAEQLNNNQKRLNQTEGQLIRDINDIVKVVLNKIIHQIDDNEN